MNKRKCKKYITKAYKAILEQNKTLSIDNLAIEIEKIINAGNPVCGT